MRDAPFARGLFTGDYEGLAVQDGNFLTLFSQPHGNDPASTYFTSITPGHIEQTDTGPGA
jgi:hypothetical protein